MLRILRTALRRQLFLQIILHWLFLRAYSLASYILYSLIIRLNYGVDFDLGSVVVVCAFYYDILNGIAKK